MVKQLVTTQVSRTQTMLFTSSVSGFDTLLSTGLYSLFSNDKSVIVKVYYSLLKVQYLLS